MASGIKVSDEVIDVFNQMKIHKTGEDTRERYKFAIFCIKDGQVVLDRMFRVKEFECEKKIFKKITKMLPLKHCCYALYDCCYKNKDSCSKAEMLFMMWAPDDASITERMVYASSCQNTQKCFSGCKKWQINDVADVKTADCLIDKLGGRGEVKDIEGVLPERACQDSTDDEDDDDHHGHHGHHDDDDDDESDDDDDGGCKGGHRKKGGRKGGARKGGARKGGACKGAMER